MAFKYSVSAVILAALSTLVFDLYIDLLLTHYYCRALSERKTYYICPGIPGDNSSPSGVFDGQTQKIANLYIPFFIKATGKSLHCEHCLVLSPHREGFSPGSLMLQGLFHQSRWTLSYSGKLSLTYSSRTSRNMLELKY